MSENNGNYNSNSTTSLLLLLLLLLLLIFQQHNRLQLPTTHPTVQLTNHPTFKTNHPTKSTSNIKSYNISNSTSCIQSHQILHHNQQIYQQHIQQVNQQIIQNLKQSIQQIIQHLKLLNHHQLYLLCNLLFIFGIIDLIYIPISIHNIKNNNNLLVSNQSKSNMEYIFERILFDIILGILICYKYSNKSLLKILFKSQKQSQSQSQSQNHNVSDYDESLPSKQPEYNYNNINNNRIRSQSHVIFQSPPQILNQYNKRRQSQASICGIPIGDDCNNIHSRKQSTLLEYDDIIDEFGLSDSNGTNNSDLSYDVAQQIIDKEAENDDIQYLSDAKSEQYDNFADIMIKREMEYLNNKQNNNCGIINDKNRRESIDVNARGSIGNLAKKRRGSLILNAVDNIKNGIK